MASKREYPEQPVVGVGGVVISDGRALLIRRGSEPLKGEWSIPGGTLEVGERLVEGVRRELREETGLEVRVGELIEVFERIVPERASPEAHQAGTPPRPQYHFVILDYLCEAIGGTPQAGSDVTDLAFVREPDLGQYRLSAAATRVLRKAFAMAQAAGRG